MIKIIRANLQHLDDLTSLGRNTFIETYQNSTGHEVLHKYVNSCFNKEVTLAELQHPKSIFFLFQKDDENIGYCKLRWDRTPNQLPDKSIEMQRLYFMEKYWKQGYGKTLLDFCLNFSRKENFNWFWLEVWSLNYSAIYFYQKNGFEKFDETVFDFDLGDKDEIDWLMKKKL